MSQSSPAYYLGLNLGFDGSAAIVSEGRVLAFNEEERFRRIKHAPGMYPIRAIRACLAQVGISWDDLTEISIGWNLEAYTDGRMRDFYFSVREAFDIDPQTVAWQDRNLRNRDLDVYTRMHERELLRGMGVESIPPVRGYPHHYTHAFQAYMQSGMDEAVCISVDGSGDQHCTVLWECRGDTLTPLREFTIPNSLGWFYAAITEYLGFAAYDGEYKVMGLAAYGEADPDIQQRLEQVIRPDADGIGYLVDPAYIHYGAHTYSDRYTDALIDLLGRPPRQEDTPVTAWHKNLAFEAQALLERTVERMIVWAVEETGIRTVCVGGGVGLNIKMNSRLLELPGVDDVFTHPLCGDLGGAAGAALLACFEQTGVRPEHLQTLALGVEFSDEAIEQVLRTAKVPYRRSPDIAVDVADELQAGRIVGWFQGRMEAGPRALGQRSILANPTSLKYRDDVNEVVKFREEWRPFCPSMAEEAADRYLRHHTYAPFMVISFPATQELADDAPAIVHVDGTSRVQLVHEDRNPLFHRLISAFAERSGVPVVLNTSFNVRGEPIVCTPLDAIRTFSASGMDSLAIGSFIIRKEPTDLGS